MTLDLAHVRKIERENGRLKARVEELEHEVRMLKELAQEPDNWVLPDAPGVWLTPTQRAIVHRLHRQGGNTVHRLCLMETLYSLEPDVDRADPKIVDVLVCHIRKKLRDTPWRVRTTWGVGYWLTREDRKEEAA